MAFSGRMHTNT